MSAFFLYPVNYFNNLPSPVRHQNLKSCSLPWLSSFNNGYPSDITIDFSPLQFWLQISVYRLKEGHFVAVFENITERKQAKDALIMVNHKLNLLSGITQHDIGNEFQLVFGYLELALHEELNPQVREHLNKVDVSAHHIARQLAFTRDYQDIGVNSPIWQDIHSVILNGVKNIDIHQIHILNDNRD